MASNGNGHDNGQARGHGLTDFVDRYQQYMVDKEKTHSFIQDILMYANDTETNLRTEISTLQQALNDTRLDLADAKKSRRDFQLRLRDNEMRMGLAPVRHPYAVLLIDGDGLIFKEHLVRKGAAGGKKAAEELHAAVIDKYSYTEEGPIDVIVQIVANVSGLSKAMRRDRCMDDEANLYDFIAGFNQVKAPFHFADIGDKSEAVDAKLLCSAHFHLRNVSCKFLLMGVSHDASYAPYLDHFIHDDSIKQRIIVIEGCPTAQEIVDTGITVTSFKDIFRGDKLKVQPLQSETPPLSETTQTTSSVPSVAPSVAPSVSYAAITQTRASPPPQITLPIPLKKAPTPARTFKPVTTVWNPGPRGLDPPIQINQAVLDKLKTRTGNEKLCNNHFLRGPCTKGDDCLFDHKYKPTKEEKNVIAFFARLSPCTKGQQCDIDNCIYGHHCPSVTNGICTHPHCKFRVDEHPPGTKFKHQRHSDWS
ncbi:hypothetical protein GGR52DRAFT_55501 [Hypoxylon sp. FL1284]|nr:hypothetical protein GGR52DRAFT_55501 [Hypoxylon sp. FL1284]